MTLTALGATHGFTAGDIDTSGYVAVIPAYQKVYFADGRLQTNKGYHKLDMVNTRLVGAASGAFQQGEVVTQATSLATGIFDETIGSGGTAWHLVYRTTTVEFDTTHLITGADSGKTLTPSSVVTPPHWTSWVETAGKEGLPEGGANIGCLCFGRIFLNNLNSPHQWYTCRVNNPLDWLVNQDDIGTPVSSQTSKAGLVGDEITAMIPFRDHYLMFGCLNEMSVLRGDPAAGGVLTPIPGVDGVFSPTSWCYDNEGNLYVLGPDALYGLSPDAIVNALPAKHLTKEHLPNLISSIGLNRRTDRVSMQYDKKRHGIAVHIVQMDGAWSTCFWIDLRTGGFFPEEYQNDHIAASMLFYNSRITDERELLLGGQDGYIRKQSETDKNDDGGNAIESWVTIGPFTDSDKPRQQIELTELSAKLGENTDGLTIEVYKNETAQKVVDNIINENNPVLSKTFSYSGLQPSLSEKILGAALAINLKNTASNQTWNIEKLVATITSGGRKK